MHCDASLRGLGAALLQPDDKGELHPVAYASKGLTPTEQRYACIERELLSIVFGTKHFHTFLYGRNFHVITDHRPLVMIVDKPLTSAPPRLQRLLIELHGYNFTITHRPGVENQLADGLSRLPSPENNSIIDLDMRVDMIRFSSERMVRLRQDTQNDPALNQLKEIIIHGWPEQARELPIDLKSFWSIRDLLSVENGTILKGQQILIPKSMQGDILKQLHTAHLGQEKTKLLARDTVYWMNMNKDIDKLVQGCEICQRHQPSQCAEPLTPHELPVKPWSILGTDLFHFGDQQWLIVADYYSKFPVVRKLPNPSPSSTVVSITKQIFAEMGIPDRVISDNGPHYSSEAYKVFAQTWDFDHVTTSPRRAQGNGFIERQIKTVKGLLKKAMESKMDMDLTLLIWRTTPISTKLGSPSQLLMGRRMKSTIPARIRNEAPQREEVQEELQQRQDSQKHFFDRRALPHDLPTLYPGQHVRVQHPVNKCWDPAIVYANTDESRSYVLQKPNGHIFRRNRQHIREAPGAVTPSVQPTIRPQPPSQVESTPQSPKTPAPVPIPTTVPEAPPQLQPRSVAPEKIEGHKVTPYHTNSGRQVNPPIRFDKS